MQYRDMKSTGDRLSMLGFGCMRLPQIKGKIDVTRSEAMIQRAIEQGVNYFDTAWSYHHGESEPFLGRVLQGHLRRKVHLATKLPQWLAQTPRDLDRLLSAQLKRLRTETIDYYLIHNLNGTSWDRVEALGVSEFLVRAQKEGCIRHAGFSFHGKLDDFKRITDAFDWDFCQIQYNYLDQQNQAGTEGLEYAAAKNLGIVIMEPLRGGLLANQLPESVEALLSRAEPRRSAADWALSWIWNRPDVHVVLSGMSTEDQLEENINIASRARAHAMTGPELTRVDEAEQAFRQLLKAGCTGCRYCMPCPHGVNIPACLDAWNGYHMRGQSPKARRIYALMLSGIMGGELGLASQCTACGQCVSACPQGLPIPELMNKVKCDLETVLTRPIIWAGRLYIRLQRWRALGWK